MKLPFQTGLLTIQYNAMEAMLQKEEKFGLFVVAALYASKTLSLSQLVLWLEHHERPTSCATAIHKIFAGFPWYGVPKASVDLDGFRPACFFARGTRRGLVVGSTSESLSMVAVAAVYARRVLEAGG